MATPSISNITNLGFVIDEEIQIVSKITGFGIPASGTQATRNIGLFGRKRLFTITGIHDGTGYAGANTDARIEAFITDIEAWVNPTAGASFTAVYTDSFGNTYNVLCASFQRVRRVDGEGRLLYTFSFIEGGLIS